MRIRVRFAPSADGIVPPSPGFSRRSRSRRRVLDWRSTHPEMRQWPVPGRPRCERTHAAPIFELVLERRFDESRDPRLAVGRLPPTAGCDVPHRADALLRHAVAPQPHGGSLDIEHASNLEDGFAMARHQGDPAPQGDLLGSGSGGDPLLEPLNLRRLEVQRRRSVGHAAMLAPERGG